MLVYTFQAALLCEECGEKVREELTVAGKAPKDPNLEYTYDSNNFPKGPDQEGESDSPSHCDKCGAFLESPLTGEGEDYVKEAVREARESFKRRSEGVTPDEADDLKTQYVALTEWEPYYSDTIDFDEESEEDEEAEE